MMICRLGHSWYDSPPPIEPPTYARDDVGVTVGDSGSDDDPGLGVQDDGGWCDLGDGEDDSNGDDGVGDGDGPMF